MNLCEGRSGIQEGMNLAGIALTAGTLFTLDAAETYQNGNGTYLAFPGAIFLALMLFLLVAGAMRVSGQKDLFAFVDYAFGHLGGSLLIAIICIAFFANAYSLLSRFAAMVHALVFTEATPFPVFLWMLPAVAYMAFRGLECISRMAKCFGVLLGGVLLLSILLPVQAYEAYRLYPLPFSRWETIVSGAFGGTFTTAPALLGLLTMAQGFQGTKNARRAGVVGAAAAIVLVALAQLAVGLTYTYTELQNIFVPLYRLNLKLLQESYFFRMDKLVLFFWLTGAMIVGAYYVYGSGYVFCRRWSRHDVRPAIAAACTVLVCCLAMEYSGKYDAVQRTLSEIRRYGSWLITMTFAAASVVALMKAQHKRRKANEAA